MENPVTVSDVEARWKSLSDAQKIVAQANLDDAWALLLHEVPDLEVNLTEGRVSEAVVRQVVCAAVLRVLKNPNGYKREEIDDYMRERAATTATGELFFTPEELARLIPDDEPSAAFTIRPYGFC